MSEEKDFKPGIYSIASERYQAARGVSKSMLDILAEKTPAHLQSYLRGEWHKEGQALRFGAIMHRALLEPDTYKGGFHVRPDDMKFTTKEGKAWLAEHEDKPVISGGESEQISRMIDSIYTHPFAKRLLADGKPEQSVFAEDDMGTLRKSRLDMLTKGNCVPDIKTCESANLDDFQRSVSRYRYHVQAAYYLDNCKLAGIDKEIFFLICIEKSPPYAVRCLKLMPEIVALGRNFYQHDLQLYRNCVNEGRWPAYGDSFDDCGLPEYEMRALESMAA